MTPLEEEILTLKKNGYLPEPAVLLPDGGILHFTKPGTHLYKKFRITNVSEDYFKRMNEFATGLFSTISS